VFGLLEVQEGDGYGEMNGRIEVCFLLVVIIIGYYLGALFHLVGTCEIVLIGLLIMGWNQRSYILCWDSRSF